MTKLFGYRAVSILATILLLSSTKLLKIILDSLTLTEQVVVSLDKSTNLKPIRVWSLDGNYLYFHDLHILVFLTAVFVFSCGYLTHKGGKFFININTPKVDFFQSFSGSIPPMDMKLAPKCLFSRVLCNDIEYYFKGAYRKKSENQYLPVLFWKGVL